jgi:hypothetical protein
MVQGRLPRVHAGAILSHQGGGGQSRGGGDGGATTEHLAVGPGQLVILIVGVVHPTLGQGGGRGGRGREGGRRC